MAAVISRGTAETDALVLSVQQQLDRLVVQLQDCEELREELDDEEYEETREDTLKQMGEFEQSLNKMMSGDVTLVDKVSSRRKYRHFAVNHAHASHCLLALLLMLSPRCTTTVATRGSAWRHPASDSGRREPVVQDA